MTLGGRGGASFKKCGFGEKIEKSRNFGVRHGQFWVPKPIENWITFPDRVLCESFLSIGFEHVWAPRSHFPIGLFFALFASFSVYPWDRFGAILGGARAKVLDALH